VHLLARSPPATQQNPDEIAEASAAERVKNERNEAIANSSGAKQGLLDVLIEKGPKTTINKKTTFSRPNLFQHQDDIKGILFCLREMVGPIPGFRRVGPMSLDLPSGIAS